MLGCKELLTARSRQFKATFACCENKQEAHEQHKYAGQKTFFVGAARDGDQGSF